VGGRRRRTTVYVQTSTTLRVIGVDTRQRARRPPWRRPGPVNLRGTPASHPRASARRPALPLSEVRDPSVVRGGWIEVALDRSSRRKIDRSRSRPGEVRLRPLRRAEVPYCEIGVGVEEPLCDDGSHPPGGQPAEPLLVLAHGRPANRSDTRLRTVSGIAPAFPPRGVVVRVAGVVAPLTCCASASSGSRTGAFTAGRYAHVPADGGTQMGGGRSDLCPSESNSRDVDIVAFARPRMSLPPKKSEAHGRGNRAFFLVFTVCAMVYGGSSLAPLAIGLTLMIMVSAPVGTSPAPLQPPL
jgi:hypothetical protein